MGAPKPLSPGQSSLALWRLGRGERSRPLAPGKWGRNATCNPSEFERLHVLFLENLKGCRLGCTPLPRRQRARAPHSWAPKGEGHLQPPVPPPTLRRPAVLARPHCDPPTHPRHPRPHPVALLAASPQPTTPNSSTSRPLGDRRPLAPSTPNMSSSYPLGLLLVQQPPSPYSIPVTRHARQKRAQESTQACRRFLQELNGFERAGRSVSHMRTGD